MTAKPKRIPALQGGKSIKPGGIYWMRYVIPAMLFYVIFMAYPMLDSIRLSLYEGTAGAREFVGLDNYVASLRMKWFPNVSGTRSATTGSFSPII